MENELYYLVDSRSYVGNSLLFWRKNSNGYTTNPDEARVFTKEEAYRQNKSRNTDKPYLKDYINSIKKYHVDMQDLRFITIEKPSEIIEK